MIFFIYDFLSILSVTQIPRVSAIIMMGYDHHVPWWHKPPYKDFNKRLGCNSPVHKSKKN